MESIMEKNWRNRVTTVLDLMFRVMKGFDHRALNRYMLSINQVRDLDGILQQAATCLKDVLNYRLFVFVVQRNDVLEAWIDPRICKNSLRSLIRDDFPGEDALNVRNLNVQNEEIGDYVNVDKTEMLSYELLSGEFSARLYVQPTRKMFLYHNEILTTIMNTLTVALTNYAHMKLLETTAAMDPLTNCYNRRVFERQLTHHLANAHRHKKSLSLVMFDIDFFKKVNDRYGHQAGDSVLTAIAATVQDSIRKGDYLARYGGEEFALLLPETPKSHALILADRLRKKIEALEISDESGNTIKVTASFGIAGIKPGMSEKNLVKESDDMLYRAKETGRNRIVPELKLCPVETAQS